MLAKLSLFSFSVLNFKQKLKFDTDIISSFP